MVQYNGVADCFNYNQDNFCCSKGNEQLYTNLMLSEARARQGFRVQNNYTAPRNYDSLDDSVPLSLRTSGLVNPTPFTFSTLGTWNVPCSRMPCGIYNATSFPCVRK